MFVRRICFHPQTVVFQQYRIVQDRLWKFSINMEKCMKSTLIKINHTEIPLFRNHELWDFCLLLQNFGF